MVRMTQVLHHHGLRDEESQGVQRTHKDYLPSLKSPSEEMSWEKNIFFGEGCKALKIL